MIRVMRLACPHDFSFRYLAKVINHVEALISFDRKLGTRGIIFFVLYIPTLLAPSVWDGISVLENLSPIRGSGIKAPLY